MIGEEGFGWVASYRRMKYPLEVIEMNEKAKRYLALVEDTYVCRKTEDSVVDMTADTSDMAAFVMDAAESKWSDGEEWKNDPFIVELKKKLVVNDDYWGDENLDFDEMSDSIAREVAMKAPTDTAARDLACNIIFAIFRSGDEKAIESAKKLGRAYIENPKDVESFMKGMREVFHALNDLHSQSVGEFQLGDLVQIGELDGKCEKYSNHYGRVVKVDNQKETVRVQVIHRGMGNVEITFFRPGKKRLTKAKVETYAERKIRENEENPNPNLLEGEPE